MAKFTCDICGGSIKMQANRTGVCQECGMEYDIEAIKAMVGNLPPTPSDKPQEKTSQNPFKNVEDMSFSTEMKTEKQEIDRKALLIYLSDVRTLETVINQNPQKILELNSKIKSIKDNMVLFEKTGMPPKPLEPDYPKEEHVGGGTAFVFISGLIMIILGLGLGLSNTTWDVTGNAWLVFWIFIFLSMCFIIPGILSLIKKKKVFSESIQRYNKLKVEYDHNLDKYNQEMQKYRIKLDENRSITKKNEIEVNKAKSQIKEETSKLTELLNKAYSANIIPMQFRNIEGVYYLYDYLSTSNQSLSEALMQANLEAIKQKLDNMIKLQAVNVIQQAQANAKLDNVIQQNKQILETAEKTAFNTELAAKYAAISAVNSEITKQLATEQLAYQKADFWLK